MAEMLDITLQFSLQQLEEKVIDSIIAQQLSLDDKLSILMRQKKQKKLQILLKMGYSAEFVATL